MYKCMRMMTQSYGTHGAFNLQNSPDNSYYLETIKL